MPPLLVEIGIAIAVSAFFVAARILLEPVIGERAPYPFVFVSIVVASMLAGWRSGLLALVIGQSAIWLLVVEPQWAQDAYDPQRVIALAVATVAQLIILAAITLYQREVARGVAEGERRMELLDQARREIDHRARNNFQTVLALVQLQAQRAKDPEVKLALQQVRDRVHAIAIATEHLAIRGDDLATVPLREHLCGLCAQLERGLSREQVKVQCEIDDVAASSTHATYLAIIVNELVTNALKHAFKDRREGLVKVRSRSIGRGLEITVADNGIGMRPRQPASGSGLGRKLVETFVKHLGAEYEVASTSGGTTHRIVVPVLA